MASDAQNKPKSSRIGQALSFVIRCVGHKSIKLKPGMTVKVGRHSSNDLVLKDGTVSRFHATIVWDPDEDRPYVIDNDSANGVEVDGEPIDGRSYLAGGNQLDIGDFTLVLQVKGMTRKYKIGADAMASKLHLIDDDKPTMVHLYTEKNKKDLKGNFEENKELKRILIDLEDDERTGTLQLRAGAKSWKVTMSAGKVVMVTRGGLSGMNVLREAFRQENGSYEFTRDLEPSEENLKISPMSLFRAESSDTLSMDQDDI